MKSLLLAFIFVLISQVAFAVAPYGITGDKQTGTLYSNVHKAPNAQITNLGGINARIETGNKNILENPSFEHLVTDTGWNTTNGTVTASVDALDGVKSASIALTGLLNFRQVSTFSSYAGNLQGLISVWVKSSLADVYVCENHNNVEGLCVLYDGSNSWREMVIPTILNASGSGFKVKTTSSSAGNIYVDDAFVGISKVTQDISNTTNWTAYAPTIVGFGATTGNNLRWRQVGGSIEIQGTFVTGAPDGSEARIPLPNSYVSSSSISTLEHAGSVAGASAAASRYYVMTREPSVSYVTFSYRDNGDSTTTFVKTTGTGISSASGQTLQVNATIPVDSLANTKIYSTASNNTDWTPCTFSTLAWTGLGTVTNTSLQCRRSMGMLEMRGKLTLGTTSGVTAEFLLPNNYGAITVGVSDNASCGMFLREQAVTSVVHNTICASAAGYVWTSAALAVGGNPGSAGTGGNFTNGDVIEYSNVRIPITGWSNSSVIVGSFQNVVTVSGITNPKFFSAVVQTTSGTITNSKGGILTSCTAANPTVCTFAGLTTTPNCTLSAVDGNNYNAYHNASITSTSISVTTALTITGASTGSIKFTIACQGD